MNSPSDVTRTTLAQNFVRPFLVTGGGSVTASPTEIRSLILTPSSSFSSAPSVEIPIRNCGNVFAWAISFLPKGGFLQFIQRLASTTSPNKKGKKREQFIYRLTRSSRRDGSASEISLKEVIPFSAKILIVFSPTPSS